MKLTVIAVPCVVLYSDTET